MLRRMENPRRVEHQLTDKGYVPVYTTAVVEQPWSSYDQTDHKTWETLFNRQSALLPGLACDEFLDGLQRFGMNAHVIPKFTDLNLILRNTTGWQLIAVEGLLPELTFFDHLANRRFPVTWWIRKPDQLDYISEPDLFHDLFGHVPLLLNPVFADYMQAYGAGGVKAATQSPEALVNLTRLYWYTVEFGLIQTKNGLRIYGAGIVSSKGESLYSLQSPAPNRVGFDLLRVMRTRYRIDTFQKTYFVINDFHQLFAATEPDFTPYYQSLAGQEFVPAADVLESDKLLHRGNGEGFKVGGDV
jgi:phenylalanine-4-hydroxylase